MPKKTSKTTKKPPTKHEKLAAALLHLDSLRCKIDPALAACIDRERAKLMTPQQIERHFQWDHDPVPRAFDGTNHPTNLNPRPVANHREKTHKSDIPKIAKVRRIVNEEKFVVKRRSDAPNADPNPSTTAETPHWTRRRPIPSRPLPGAKASGWKKDMSGKATRRSDKQK